MAVYCNNMQFRGVPFQSKWWGGASNAAGSPGPGGTGGIGENRGEPGSVRPKPGFGIGNRNQDQVSVSVYDLKDKEQHLDSQDDTDI